MSDDFLKQLHVQKLQALGHLAGGVAHDFNNILSIVEGYARMIAKQLEDDHPAQEKLENILKATKRGASLTKSLLAFGRQHIMTETFCDLAQALAENDILLRPLLTKRINLVMPQIPVGSVIRCNTDMLSQILINLAVNARDAMNGDGTITIGFKETPDTVSITFADTGSGIDPEILPKIFDPFFTTKEQGKGTGLGLSMVAGAMAQLGGRIDVHSVLGKGTVFTLTFAKMKSSHAANEPSHAFLESPLRNKTVLVVDDEETLLPVLEAQLRDMGMKVLKAANADTALLLQKDYAEEIDLLLTDVVMPGLNGVTLSELVKRARPETGIVFMTGYPNRADTAAQGSPLPDDALVVGKPFDPGDLSPALLKALERVQNMRTDETPPDTALI